MCHHDHRSALLDDFLEWRKLALLEYLQAQVDSGQAVFRISICGTMPGEVLGTGNGSGVVIPAHGHAAEFGYQFRVSTIAADIHDRTPAVADVDYRSQVCVESKLFEIARRRRCLLLGSRRRRVSTHLADHRL